MPISKVINENLTKDTSTGLLQNQNFEDIQNYRARRAETERLNKVENLLDEVKHDLQEVKSILEKNGII